MSLDGRRIVVFEPGTLNDAGGPDFLGACVAIGNTLYRGDVELHRSGKEWIQHGHHHNPAYNTVILHVVLEKTAASAATMTQSGRPIPVLVLEPFLLQPIQVLKKRIQMDERLRVLSPLPCRGHGRAIHKDVLRRWLFKLALQRLEWKIHHFDHRIKQLALEHTFRLHEPRYGYSTSRIEGFPDEVPLPLNGITPRDLSQRTVWEDVLYEGIMDALGYSKNREPFTRLSRSVSLNLVRRLRIQRSMMSILGVLFGVSGLLPGISSLSTKESKAHARNLHREWRRLRNVVRTERLRDADWQFFPTRPVNFPTVRIAAAASIIQEIVCHDFFRRLIQTVKASSPPDDRIQSLIKLFHIEPDQFWKQHYHFHRPAKRPFHLLGTGRILDMIVNVVFPLCLLYARIFRDRAVRESILSMYETCPRLADNSVTRTIQCQLLGTKLRLETACLQQGAIQLYKHYCSEERCKECAIGKVLFP